MSTSRVLLTTLSVRRSAKGTEYLSGWLGKASVVAFSGEPDKFGNATWDVFVCPPEQRQMPGCGRALAAHREHISTSGAGGRPGGSGGCSGVGPGNGPADAAARPGTSYEAGRSTIPNAQRRPVSAPTSKCLALEKNNS